MFAKKKFSNDDRREYIRLPSVFPVEFAFSSLEKEKNVFWRQGYTCNVGAIGLCLETIDISKEDIVWFKSGQEIDVSLRVHMPLTRPALKSTAKLAWVKKIHEDVSDKYLIGVQFSGVACDDVKRMVGYARYVKFSARAVKVFSFVFFLMVVFAGMYSYRLRHANAKLVGNLVLTQREHREVVDQMEAITREKEFILSEIDLYTEQASAKEELQGKYENLLQKENKIVDYFKILDRKKSGLEKDVFEKMHLWLQNHQSAATGLVLSFEGNVGVVKDWAFIYDQALAASIFLFKDNMEDARAILSFFHNEAGENFQGFSNAYYYDSGKIAEFTVHCGPNIWVGIAAAQYVKKTGDDFYLTMARKVADWLITVQDRDKAGGLKGGPEFSWFATEHNLDAYAFFDMMYQLTNEEKYRIARERVLSWLQMYAMLPHSKDYKAPPINRGRGDATIATDTYAWSLAALGPRKLSEMGMDPEEIMKFAEEHCQVEVQYQRPSGVMVNVEGFDFAKYVHMPRGGLVSPEWTAQMIISFNLLSEYFFDRDNEVKGHFYAKKAKGYLDELNKLIIASSSARGQGEGCLPYATLEDADTGHGWNTPYGASTCSIAGTAYTMMAITNFNPLMFKESQASRKMAVNR